MINVGAQLRVAESQANDVVTRLFPLHDPDLLEHLRLHWAKPWAGIGKRWLRHPFYQDIDTVRDYFRRAHCLLLRVARVPCESCRYALGPELEQLPPIHGHARRCGTVVVRAQPRLRGHRQTDVSMQGRAGSKYLWKIGSVAASQN